MSAYSRALLTIFILIPLSLTYSEEKSVYLRGGAVVKGEILEETDEYIKIKTANGLIGKLEKKFIEKVGTPTQEPSNINPPEPEVSESPNIQNPTQETAIPDNNTIQTETKSNSVESSDKTESGLNDLSEKNRRFELSYGIGYGLFRNTPDLAAFKLKDMGQVGLNGEESNIYLGGYKENQPGPVGSLEVNYYKEKFAYSLSGSYFTGESNDFSQYILNNNLNINVKAKEPHTNTQFFIKSDINYLAYSDAGIQLRPQVGILETSAKTDAHSSLMNPIYSSTFYVNGMQQNSMKESMRGPLIGLKLSVRLNPQIENRFELYSAFLSGQRDHNASLIYQEFSSSSIFEPAKFTSFSENLIWNATARYLSYKFIFHTSNFSIWVGVQSLFWKYNLEAVNFGKYASEPVSITDVAVTQLFLKTFASPYLGTSRSESIELGIMKASDF
ncbi:hypothetical protein [Leptospira sarikeiensis]|uniref:Uncharacterized protein n=1 Tax=Leptospira sarikeiensis TaxID=2484943 RepID=A0A4R9KCR1_9LEPT|nr:hypothetical protein [Leptospira sarikeiensis]TGL63705.1 hypothetical protein EHQ64_07090 [Leptospira sarikeiensis]